MYYKPNKYKNIKTIINGIKFDSKKEAKRYTELKLLEKSNLIHDLEIQKEFILIPKTERNRKASYYADFVYYDKDNNYIIEDVKSDITRKNPLYRFKRNFMKYKGFNITEI